MADPKLAFLPTLSGSELANDDYIRISDASADVSGESKVSIGELRKGITPSTIMPSGDSTGAMDAVAIQAAIDATGFCQLAPGDYYTNTSIILATDSSLFGSGLSTKIYPTANDYAVIQIGEAATNANNVTVKDLWIEGGLLTSYGLYGIHLLNCTYIHIMGVKVAHTSSHGIFIERDNWNTVLTDVETWGCGGDGLNSVSDATYDTGIALTIQGCRFRNSAANGVTWCSNTLSVTGSTLENSGAYGLHLQCTANAQIRGAFVAGNHFENNATAGIAITGVTGKTAQGIKISANTFDTDSSGDAGHILILGDNDTVRNVIIDETNTFDSGPTAYVVESGALQYGQFSGDTSKFTEAAGNLSLWKGLTGNIEFGFNSAVGVHFGRSAVDNTWRIAPSSTNLAFGRRESGSYVTKFTIPSAIPVVATDATVGALITAMTNAGWIVNS